MGKKDVPAAAGAANAAAAAPGTAEGAAEAEDDTFDVLGSLRSGSVSLTSTAFGKLAKLPRPTELLGMELPPAVASLVAGDPDGSGFTVRRGRPVL